MFGSGPTAELPVVEVAVSGVAEQANAIDRLVDGSIAGVIVRGVIPAPQAAELVRSLEREGDSLPTFRPSVFKGHVFGRPLVSAEEGIPTYLDAAEGFRAGCAAIFDCYPLVERRVHDVLTSLAGGRPVSVPRGGDGRPYLSATIRVLLEGDRLPPHYENATLDSPVMAALRPLLDLSTLMSFYVPLAMPPSGGLLRLFRTNCLDGGDSLIARLGSDERAQAYLEQQGFSVVIPQIGDLLVFDGGRWYHDVTPVEGGMRWTLGGFLAPTRDRSAVHYWS